MKYKFHVNKQLLKERDRRSIDRFLKKKKRYEETYVCYIDFSWSEWELNLTAYDEGEVYLALLSIGECGIADFDSIEYLPVNSLSEIEDAIFTHIWGEMKDQINAQDLKKICIEKPEIVLTPSNNKGAK